MFKPPRKIRRVLFWVVGNVLLFALTWAFIAVVGEVWLRLRWPFPGTSQPMHFVPKVGYMLKPNAEVRVTNHLDLWTVSRTNSWGFLDREPIAAERAVASCHIALIGDSYVAAEQVPIVDKLQVRLERLAARVLPELDVTTSAFGINNTGQLNQLPLYDEFARRLRPKLVVLVFVNNDFADNSSVLKSLVRRWDPDRMPWVSARRDAHDRMRLLPPDPDGWRPLPYAKISLHSLKRRTYRQSAAFRRSYFANWLDVKFKYAKLSSLKLRFLKRLLKEARLIRVAEELRHRPGYESLLGGWQPKAAESVSSVFWIFNQKDLPPFFEAALDFTAFGLDQFKQRADRDGASLVILSTNTMGTTTPLYDHMHALATARGIPVIDQSDYLRRQGASSSDVHWRRVSHWNAAGHQWAAEAVLEYLKQNPAVCRAAGPR